MKRLSRIFLTGLLALVPLALTLALLIWFVGLVESGLGAVLKFVLPQGWYVPGEGLLLGIALVFGAGVLLQSRYLAGWFGRGESLLERIPLIRAVYAPIREMTSLLRRQDREIGRPVRVSLPWNDNQMLGFVTQDQVGEAFGGDDVCAVYLPMSYQIGGFMLLVEKRYVERVDLDARQALRFAFTSGMAGGGRASGSRSPETPES